MQDLQEYQPQEGQEDRPLLRQLPIMQEAEQEAAVQETVPAPVMQGGTGSQPHEKISHSSIVFCLIDFSYWLVHEKGGATRDEWLPLFFYALFPVNTAQTEGNILRNIQNNPRLMTIVMIGGIRYCISST